MFITESFYYVLLGQPVKVSFEVDVKSKFDVIEIKEVLFEEKNILDVVLKNSKQISKLLSAVEFFSKRIPILT